MLHRDPASLSLISSRRPRMWSLTSPLMADRLAPILTMSIVISRISSCSVCSSPFFGCFWRWDTLNSYNCNNKMQQQPMSNMSQRSFLISDLVRDDGWPSGSTAGWLKDPLMDLYLWGGGAASYVALWGKLVGLKGLESEGMFSMLGTGVWILNGTW